MSLFSDLFQQNAGCISVQYSISFYCNSRIVYRVEGNFCGLAIFCVLRKLFFVIRTDWFYMLGINFCEFQKVPSTQH